MHGMDNEGASTDDTEDDPGARVGFRAADGRWGCRSRWEFERRAMSAAARHD